MQVPQFQLVLRDRQGDRSIAVDASTPGERTFGGQALREGVTIEYGGERWIVVEHSRADGIDRYFCVRAKSRLAS